jgi:hypothetical protein
MPTPTLQRVYKDARKSDQSQVTIDPNGKSPATQTVRESWVVIYAPTGGTVDQITAQNATGLPVVNTVYTIGGSAVICTSKQAVRRKESPFVWDVLVEYSKRTLTGGGTTTNFNISIRKTSAAREETATVDRLGLPLSNTYGQLLPQLPNVTLYDEVLTITFDTSVVPTWGDIEGKTNNDSVSFTICGISRSFTKSQMKCIGATYGVTKQVNAITGGVVTYNYIYNCELVFQIRKPKWVWTAPNEGWEGYNDSDVQDTFRNPRTDPQGAPLTAPAKMSLDGHRLYPGDNIIKLPNDAIGAAIPNGNRTYDADGAFELEQQASFSSLLTPLND